MCTSITQTLFNVGLVIGCGLTVAAFLTPSWIKDESGQYGFFSCLGKVEKCSQEIWTDFEPWERVTFVCLAASIVTCAVALLWSTILCCCLCCFRHCFIFTLPMLVLLACILNIVGVSVYATHAADRSNFVAGRFFSDPQPGNCIWIGTAAILALFGDFVLALFLVRVSKTTRI